MLASPKEYAALRGVSVAAISKAAKDGRLKNSIQRGKNNRLEKIDVIIANQEWEANTDHSKVRFHNRQPIEAIPPIPSAPEPENLELPLEPVVPSSRDARYNHDLYKSKIAKLDYDERIGRLVSADTVKDEAFKVARTLRDALMNIPDRIATEVAGMIDAHAIHKRLSDELRMALKVVINA